MGTYVTEDNMWAQRATDHGWGGGGGGDPWPTYGTDICACFSSFIIIIVMIIILLLLFHESYRLRLWKSDRVTVRITRMLVAA